MYRHFASILQTARDTPTILPPRDPALVLPIFRNVSLGEQSGRAVVRRVVEANPRCAELKAVHRDDKPYSGKDADGIVYGVVASIAAPFVRPR
jgi:hypothetical protein